MVLSKFTQIWIYVQTVCVCYLRNRKQRSVIAKFRSPTMNRHSVESGWHRGLPHVERVCFRCYSKDSDDEEHCLLWCNSFVSQCEHLINKAIELIPGFVIFSWQYKPYKLLTNTTIVNFTASFIPSVYTGLIVINVG